MSKIASLDATLTEPSSYGDREVIHVSIGAYIVGTLYRVAEDTAWSVYRHADKDGRFGDDLGSDESSIKMARRLLATKGYISLSDEINAQGNDWWQR